MLKRFTKKVIIVFVLLSTLVSLFSIFSFAENENSTDSSFQGYSGNMTLAELEAETNTSKDGNGDFITPVNTSAPQIVFCMCIKQRNRWLQKQQYSDTEINLKGAVSAPFCLLIFDKKIMQSSFPLFFLTKMKKGENPP